MLEIKFKEKKYLLIGSLKEGGAITTEKSYTEGLVSFAHLFRNGKIYRFQTLIGTKDDITILGEKNVTPKKIAYWRFIREMGKILLGAEGKKKGKK